MFHDGDQDTTSQTSGGKCVFLGDFSEGEGVGVKSYRRSIKTVWMPNSFKSALCLNFWTMEMYGRAREHRGRSNFYWCAIQLLALTRARV
jgi:hypothetical protein